MPATPCLQDASFGPVSTCRTFDFTLLFESAVLSILPSALFILLALLLLYDLLLRKPTRVLTPLRYLPQLGKQLIAWKIAFSGGAIVCDAIALAAWVSRAGRADATPGFSATTASLALRLTAALLTAPVAYLEFFRRLQGSPLLPLGLLIFTLCDAARIRTFGFFSLAASPSDSLFFGTFVAGVACRVALWILETAPKGAFVERAEGDKAITSEETSSFFARLLITSVDPLLWRGFRTTLTIQSLGSIHSRYDAERLYSAGIDHWRILSKDGRTKHPLFRTMFKAFGSTLVAPVLPCVIYSLAQITQPTLVSDVITFVESYQTGNAADQQPVQNGYGLIAAYFLVFAISTLSWSLFQMSALRSAVAVRGFLVQMIYRKALLIHQDVAKEIGTGSSTSLMSVDVERMVTQLEPFHLLYSSFIIVTVGLVILYYTVGIAFVATIVVAVLFIASVPIATRSIPKHQRAWSGRTDLRVKLLNSVIRNIKAVKLSGYEELLIRKLEAFRNHELEKQAAYLWRILAVSLYSNSLRSALSIATLVTYTIISQHSEAHAVDTATFFTAISVLAVVSDPLLIVAQRFGAIMAATASLARIQEFLLKEERQDTRLDAGENGSISGEGLSLGTKDLALLRDMTFALSRGSLTMVVGTVGSGKTTFLHGLMGEVDGTQGILRFPKAMSVGFCAQDAFLRPGDTIRQNIQFLSPAQPALYRAVVKACALDIDFKVWPQGDKQKAQGLSGGQRQRIALARALYARPDILVLDDIFSALDKTTEEHVFQALFGLGGLLVGKTVVLSTNAVHRLPNADQILLLENNTIGQQGTFAELSENPGAVRDLLTLVKETREHDQDVSREPGAAAAMGHAGEDAASSYLASLNLANTVDEIEEEMAAERSKRSPIKVFMTAGGLISFAIMILLLTVAPAASAVVPIYVQEWTSAIRSDQSQIYTYLGGYVALEFCAALLLGLGLYYIFLVYVRRSSRRLHGKEVRAILRTSLSYFDSVPIGRILSRFSQDLFVIDFELGNYFCNFWALLIEMLVTCVVLTVAAPYVGIAVAFTFILCIAIQRFYLRTSRQVRRMDFIAKSPLYTLFAETVDVNGLRTFRAARAEDSLAGLAVAKGNTSQVPYYYMNGVKKWLNLVLGGVTTGINTILVTVAVIQRANTSSGLLAVALVQAVQLTFFLNHTIVSLADFETALVALSRIQEVIELPPEEVVGPDGKSHAPVGGIDYSEDVDDEDKDVGIPLKQKGKADEWDWITAGSVRFQNVVLKYRPELPPALKNLSFKVPGGQKVGIVGRSGCGKSTALQALFRMVECESGSIYIDGVDIRSMPRTMLRSAMTIIPQDPLLLELSIRENLDLEGTCSDQELWAALEQTQCKSLVEALPEKLETLVSGDGGDFSRGERQLLALARALLRKRKILVLDEASSSLDIASDARMQEVLRRAFDRCTIITVAHRLNTLLDYDEIIVLSAGELVEQGNPQRLLRGSPNGPFSQLVRGEQAAVEGEEAQEDLDIIRELA